MKRLICILMAAIMLFGLMGCGEQGGEPTESAVLDSVVLDASGKYELDTLRNEAIIDDAGLASDSVDGNARVYYHIFVGSFSDSNGDGIGDLRGIINRFDYLNDGEDNSGVSLGVEGIWLSPIFTSPSYHKYDVSNYYEIDPSFGTMEDLAELIELCHSRDVQIILDLPINHTSSRNEWFLLFKSAHQNNNTESEYYDFYSYSPTNAAGATYSTITGTSEYYECNFSSDMPELNFNNEAVRQTVVDIAKYYLNLGVDGFRFDAAKYIYYGKEAENAQFWEWYMSELRAIKSDIYTVAEVWDSDSVTFPYFTSTNCFNFTMSQSVGMIAKTAKEGNVNSFTAYVSNYLSEIKARNPDALMMTFIANHDMDRAAGFLTVASGQAKVAANLSILLPGSSFIYYGEEIGLKGSRGSSSTDANRRLAMLWGDDDTVKNPIGSDYGAEQVNGTVADQLPDGDSLYSHYKKLIAIRKANPEIAYGDFTALEIADSKLGGFLSSYNGSTVMVLHNTTLEAVTIDLTQITDLSFTVLSAYAGCGSAVLDGTTLTIDGQTSAVLR